MEAIGLGAPDTACLGSDAILASPASGTGDRSGLAQSGAAEVGPGPQSGAKALRGDDASTPGRKRGPRKRSRAPKPAAGFGDEAQPPNTASKPAVGFGDRVMRELADIAAD